MLVENVFYCRYAECLLDAKHAAVISNISMVLYSIHIHRFLHSSLTFSRFFYMQLYYAIRRIYKKAFRCEVYSHRAFTPTLYTVSTEEWARLLPDVLSREEDELWFKKMCVFSCCSCCFILHSYCTMGKMKLKEFT